MLMRINILPSEESLNSIQRFNRFISLHLKSWINFKSNILKKRQRKSQIRINWIVLSPAKEVERLPSF